MKILFINCGGTMASNVSDKGLVPQISGEDMLKFITVDTAFKVDTISPFNIDSTDLNLEHIQKIGDAIYKNYHSYDGFLISHGTDTLAFSTSAITFMFRNLDKPIVFVASQYTFFEEKTDAKANLLAAFHFLKRGYNGVFAICGGKVIKGQYLKKIASSSLESFASSNREYVASYSLDEEKLYSEDFFTIYLPSPKIENKEKVIYFRDLEERIGQIILTPLLQKEDIQCLKDKYKAFVVHSFGAGGVRGDVLEELKALSTEKIVILTTQCIYDGTNLSRYAVGQRAKKSKILAGRSLTYEAITMLLAVELKKGSSIEEIKKVLRIYTLI